MLYRKDGLNIETEPGTYYPILVIGRRYFILDFPEWIYTCLLDYILFHVKKTLIPDWISNYMPSKVWDKITYAFPSFNGSTVEV